MQSLDRGQILVAGLVATGLLATEIVLGDQQGSVAAVLTRFLLIGGLAAGLAWRSRSQSWPQHGLLSLLALVTFASPLLFEPIWRMATNTGHPLELQLLIGFRNLSVLFVIFAQYRRFEYLAVTTSLFTVLFCVSTSQDQSLVWLTGLYMILGIAWLVQHYWSSLRTDLVVERQTHIPWKLLTVLGVVPLIAIMVMSVPDSVRLSMIEGFMPSSGGTGKHDPYARSGIGDGDAVVAATNKALSFAPIEDAPFIEGNEPSLYDVFQDTYGKPKPVKKMERAISLPPELFQPNHHRMAKAKKSSRTFTLEREPAGERRHRHLKDTESNAMLHLVGPVPAHLRHTAYDLFDGYEWYPQEARPIHVKPLSVENETGKPWIVWRNRELESVSSRTTQHALRVLNVDTNRILAPVNLQGVHIDRCDRPDLFVWKQEDVLAMTRTSLPGMAVIHLQSQLVDHSSLNQDSINLGFGLVEYRALPEGPGMAEIRNLAEEWTAGAENDWQRVVAIRDQLKNNYELDPEVSVPEDCENPTLWFLEESRRGPDYMFATATVMLCRAAGISSRAVSGLYANPDKYDISAGQTSVHPSDVHWWAEVYAGPDHWAVVESCPGFTAGQPPRPWLATMYSLMLSGGRLMVTYWPVTLLVCLLGAFTFHRRREVLSRLLVWRWELRRRFSSDEDARRLMLESAVCYDKRRKLGNNPRPQHSPMATLLKTDSQSLQELSCEDRQRLAAAIDWACYGPADVPMRADETAELTNLCRRWIRSDVTSPRADVPTASL